MAWNWVAGLVALRQRLLRCGLSTKHQTSDINIILRKKITLWSEIQLNIFASCRFSSIQTFDLIVFDTSSKQIIPSSVVIFHGPALFFLYNLKSLVTPVTHLSMIVLMNFSFAMTNAVPVFL